MEQRIRDIQQNLAHNAMSGEFENLQPLVDEATVSLLQLIREAQIAAVDEKLDTLIEVVSYLDLCEEDSDKILIWAKNHKRSLIAPPGENTKAKESE